MVPAERRLRPLERRLHVDAFVALRHPPIKGGHTGPPLRPISCPGASMAAFSIFTHGVAKRPGPLDMTPSEAYHDTPAIEMGRASDDDLRNLPTALNCESDVWGGYRRAGI